MTHTLTKRAGTAEQLIRRRFLVQADAVVAKFSESLHLKTQTKDEDDKYFYVRSYGVNLAALGLFVQYATTNEMENAMTYHNIMEYVLYWFDKQPYTE